MSPIIQQLIDHTNSHPDLIQVRDHIANRLAAQGKTGGAHFMPLLTLAIESMQPGLQLTTDQFQEYFEYYSNFAELKNLDGR